MAHRIRKARILSTTNGEEQPAFVFDESETEYEVLLATEEEFTILFFDKVSMVERSSHYLLYIPQEDL
jgi:hypothetical protein